MAESAAIHAGQPAAGIASTTSSSPATRFARRRWWIFPVLFCVAFFLFTPKTPPNACIQPIRIADSVQLHLNCDSRLLAKMYRNAEKYFTEFNAWKGRPVYFFYGVVAAPVMEPIAVPLWAAIGSFATSDRSLSHYRKYFSLHLAYYALNIGVVLFTVWMALNMLGLLRPGLANAGRLAIALSAAIASTDLVAGTVWVTHTTIFNLLAPIACSFFVLIGFQARRTRPGLVLAWAAFAGLMVLVYPLYVLLLPALFTGIVLDLVLNRSSAFAQKPTGVTLTPVTVNAVLAAIIMVLPVAGWTLIVKHGFTTPVYLTAQYGQFIWLFDAYREGKLVAALGGNLSAFVAALRLHFSWFEIVLPLAGCAVLLVAGDRSRLNRLDPVLTALIIAVLAIWSFNYLQGYYAARLHVSVVSLFYVIVARLADLVNRRAIGIATLAVITGVQIVDASLHYEVTAD